MTFLVVVLSFVMVFLSAILLYKKKHQRYYDLLKQFPSYRAYPIIGSIKPSHCVLDNLLKTFEELFKSHDRIIYWFGPKPILLLKNFDDISTIANQNSDRNLFGFAYQWLGNGILTHRHAEWKKSRKLLTPAFTSGMLEKYCHIFNKKFSTFVDKLKPFAVSGEEINIQEYVADSKMETTLESIMGISMEMSEKEVKGLGDAVYQSLHDILKRVMSPWLHPHIIYSIYLKLSGKTKIIKELNRLPTKIMKENIKNTDAGKYQSENVDSSKCIVNLMIKARQQDSSFTDTRLKDELLEMFGAGTDTTSQNVSFTLLMLAIHQDIQQKVYEEITQLVGEHEEFTSDHLFNHLKYLEQCIRESLRMYNPAAMISRQSQKEHVLKDNTIVPADLTIGFVYHLAQHDSALYKNPHKWNPENFSEQAIASRPKGSDLSFGIGPRSCLGAKYAILSNKSQIAQIIRCYHVSTSIKELRPDDLILDVAIRSKLGYPIRFKLRKKTQQEKI